MIGLEIQLWLGTSKSIMSMYRDYLQEFTFLNLNLVMNF